MRFESAQDATDYAWEALLTWGETREVSVGERSTLVTSPQIILNVCTHEEFENGDYYWAASLYVNHRRICFVLLSMATREWTWYQAYDDESPTVPFDTLDALYSYALMMQGGPQ